jgi:hypothetical protein
LKKRFTTLAFMSALVAFAIGTDFTETEPNGTKAQANQFVGLVGGDRILGGLPADEMDWFRVTMAPKATGIWLSRIQLTLPGGGTAVDHNATLMGLSQTNGVVGSTETILQESLPNTNTPNILQWYGFGKSESLYFFVDSPATPGDYVATLTQTQISPNVISQAFQEGSVTITTVGQTGATQTDTDLWLYDANFNAISGAGNDDVSGGASLGSTLTRNLAAGTYYLAISNYNLANNQASPVDDAYRNGAVTDFPNLILNSSSSGEQGADNISFRITDGFNILNQTSSKSEAFQVQFYQFNVVPEPGTMAVLGLGSLGLFARRRRAKNR